MSTLAGRLIGFARELQSATTFAEVLTAAQTEITEIVGYSHAWLFIADDADPTLLRLIDMAGAKRALAWEDYAQLSATGDAMIAEILRGDALVLVEDARTDPRTNKEIVAHIGNRTIVNVPLRLLDRPLGIFGTGTFGDEGCRVPTQEQQDQIVAMTSQITVAVARIRLLEERAHAARLNAKLEQRLQHMQRLDSLGLLAAGVAHDFNNLLTVIQAGASMLQSVVPTTSRADLDAIVQAADRATMLTRQLLAMGRAQELARAPTDVNTLLRSMLSLLNNISREKIAVQLSEASERALVMADESQLHQVFLNICLNARDAMPNGGSLSVEVKQVTIGATGVEHPRAKPGKYILVAISDTGIGMSKELMERVFEPFFSTKPPTERSGSGLGLAVAYGIVRQHEGFMHCESELGKGTCFKVYLPVLERISRNEASASPPGLWTNT